MRQLGTSCAVTQCKAEGQPAARPDKHGCMSRDVMLVMNVLLQNQHSFMVYRTPVSPQLSPRSSPGPCHTLQVRVLDVLLTGNKCWPVVTDPHPAEAGLHSDC